MLTNGIRFQYKSSQPLEKSQQNCQRMRFRLGSSHLTFIRIEIGSKEASVWNRKFCLKYNTLHRFDLKLSQCAPYHLFLIMVWYFIYDQQTVLFLLLVLFLTFTLICWDFLNNNSLADSECFAVGIYRVTRWLWRIYYSFIPVCWFVLLTWLYRLLFACRPQSTAWSMECWIKPHKKYQNTQPKLMVLHLIQIRTRWKMRDPRRCKSSSSMNHHKIDVEIRFFPIKWSLFIYKSHGHSK